MGKSSVLSLRRFVQTTSLDGDEHRSRCDGVSKHKFDPGACAGPEWRAYCDVDDEDPMTTDIACGADTFELTDIGGCVALVATGPE